MTAEQKQRIKDVFESVLDSPLAERTHLIGQLCADDAVVRAEVEALLRAHTEADGFLAGSPLRSLAFERSPTPPFDFAGRRIGVYELQREIGQGGMATVYLAERMDGEYRQQVALKLVWPSGDLNEITRRFKRERQILAALDHPNIARLLDGGTTAEGWPYLVMEYIAGVHITHYCRAHNLVLTERLRLFQTVCAAVAYAHRNLVVHRDIKPSNILVTENGAEKLPKLLDFGIAKLLAPDAVGEAQPTITGLRPMTPEYASPEQMREETITTATDVYSLGVLLYELLTGAHPHDLKDRPLHEITRIVCEEDPPPPSVRVPQLRGDLDNITLVALRKEPSQRYQTVEQFSIDITRFLAGETVTARPATLLYRTGKFVRRNKTGVAVTATVLLLLLSGLFITLRQNRLQRYQLYAADMRQAGQDWAEGNLVEMDALLEAHRPGTGSDEWRGFEWFALWKLLHVEKFTLPHQSWVHVVCYTPDGKTILTGSRDGRIEMWDAMSGIATGTYATLPEAVVGLLISGDGKRMVTGGGYGVFRIWDFAERRVIAELPHFIKDADWNDGAWFALSPDGKRLAVYGNDQTFKLWETATGQLVETIALPVHLPVSKFGAAVYSPDGRLICLGLKGRRWELWDVLAHRSIALLDPQSNDPAVLIPSARIGLIFSRDGRRFYLPSRDEKLRVWDIGSGELLHVFSGHQNMIETPAVSFDDKLLVTGSEDQTLRFWATETGKPLAVVKNGNQVFYPVFSPDNKYVAAVSMRAMQVKVWEVQKLLAAVTSFDGLRAKALSPDGKGMLTEGFDGEGPALRNVLTGQKVIAHGTVLQLGCLGANCVNISADGKLFTARRESGSSETLSGIDVRETASGKLVAHLEGHIRWVNATAFSPDGKTLATAGEDKIIKLWDTATWHERARLQGHIERVHSADFSPDGSKLATGSWDNTVKLWDAVSGKELLTLRGHRAPVYQAKFSPDGKLLASASWDYTVKLWDAVAGRELRTLKGHANSVYTVAFSPDGKRLASGGDDRTVRVWDVQTGEQLTALHGYTDKVWQVFFTPDGKTLLSSSEKETRLWRAATEEEVRARAKQ